MIKINLHLKYKKETGKDRPDVSITERVAQLDEEDKEDVGIKISQSQAQEVIDYVEWLEEAVDSILSINEELLDQLRNKPTSVTIEK